MMTLTLELEQEADGCWIAEVTELPALVYGATGDEAIAGVNALALRVLADLLGTG